MFRLPAASHPTSISSSVGTALARSLKPGGFLEGQAVDVHDPLLLGPLGEVEAVLTGLKCIGVNAEVAVSLAALVPAFLLRAPGADRGGSGPGPRAAFSCGRGPEEMAKNAGDILERKLTMEAEGPKLILRSALKPG